MAYSRFTTSRWYTYWQITDNSEFTFPTVKRKNSEVFMIQNFPSIIFTYAELTRNIDECLLHVCKRCAHEYEGNILKYNYETGHMEPEFIIYPADPATEEELQELKGYMQEFISDVDSHYEWRQYFRFEWWLPIRNAVARKLKCCKS